MDRLPPNNPRVLRQAGRARGSPGSVPTAPQPLNQESERERAGEGPKEGEARGPRANPVDCGGLCRPS